jgi:hypothetical protein
MEEKERKFAILKDNDIVDISNSIKLRNILIGGITFKNITKTKFPSSIILDDIKETIIGIDNLEIKFPEYFLN